MAWVFGTVMDGLKRDDALLPFRRCHDAAGIGVAIEAGEIA